jgi:hypothetical protein
MLGKCCNTGLNPQANTCVLNEKPTGRTWLDGMLALSLSSHVTQVWYPHMCSGATAWLWG